MNNLAMCLRSLSEDLREGDKYESVSEYLEGLLESLNGDLKNNKSLLPQLNIQHVIDAVENIQELVFSGAYSDTDIAYIAYREAIFVECAFQEVGVLKYRLDNLKDVCGMIHDFFVEYDSFCDFWVNNHNKERNRELRLDAMNCTSDMISSIDKIIDEDPGTDKDASIFIRDLCFARDVLAKNMIELLVFSNNMRPIDGESTLNYIKELISNHIDFNADTYGEFALKGMV